MPARMEVIWLVSKLAFRWKLAVTVALAIEIAAGRLPSATPGLLLSIRAPARAAASAAFWLSVRETASSPRSTASAVNPHRVIRQTARVGMIDPRRVGWRRRSVIGDPPSGGVDRPVGREPRAGRV